VPNTTDTLLTLPPEIRNIIYEYVLACPPKYHIITNLNPHSSWEPPFITAASTQICREAAPIHYNKNKITVAMVFGINIEDRLRGMGPKNVNWTVGTLRNIYDLYSSKTLSKFEFSIQMQQREGYIRLDDLLPLLELIGKSGLILGVRDGSLYSESVPRHVRDDLNEAIAIGERAYERGWNGGTLGAQFKKWKRKKIQMQQEEIERRVEEVDRLEERARIREQTFARSRFDAAPHLSLYTERWLHGRGGPQSGRAEQLGTGEWYYEGRRVFLGTIPRWRYI
jgi:hypothetical protein